MASNAIRLGARAPLRLSHGSSKRWCLFTRFARHIGLAHGPIVAEHEQGEELDLKIAMGRSIRCASVGVERDEIGLPSSAGHHWLLSCSPPA